jgi:molecular chaperone DnaJ
LVFMAQKRDYYEVLGVGRNAAPEDIKRAYRKGALKCHPDNYRGDKTEAEAKFKELSEAYEVLADPVKRQRYDRYGHAGLRGAGLHDFSQMGFGDIFSMFEDIFGRADFGMGGRRGRAERGLDLETEVELTLEQVATGVNHTLEFERMDLCGTCSGSGARPGSSPQTCPACRGYGQQRHALGPFLRVVPCARCGGKGTVVTDPCPDCEGTGRARTQRVLTVRIPPGVGEGQVVRVPGEGEPNRAGTARGDLHLYVRVKPHPLLTRRGSNLLCQVPVAFTQAALGATVRVPVLGGTEEVQVPAGTQNADIIRLKQRGLPSPRNGRKGDQFVQVFIEVPKRLTRDQRHLLEEYAKTEQEHLTSERRSFLAKLKQYFSSDK